MSWIDAVLAGSKSQLACDAIREANQIVYGIGVYTVMELFFMAGNVLPFVTWRTVGLINLKGYLLS